MYEGDVLTVNFTWDEALDIGGSYTFKAVIYPASPYVSDKNMTNNVMADPPTQVVWWPDCNGPVEGIWAQWPSVGDNVINGKDLRALSRAWPPEPYRLVCDYDANTVIEGKDLKVLSKYWATSYPDPYNLHQGTIAEQD
jgi:hypothetical protein